MGLISQFLIVTAALAALLFGCAMQPRYHGPPSAHFDGLHFQNELSADKSLWDIVKFVAALPVRKQAWPSSAKNAEYPAPADVARGIAVTYINHSTVLLQIDGINILTDPIWSERASPFTFAGPKRVRPPGLALTSLPPIDVVLISHDHYDHLDIATLKALNPLGRDGPPLILVGLGNADLLTRHGINNFRELDWWQACEHRGLEFVFVEVRHRSGRGFGDQMKSLWGGFVIKADGGQVYFAGDSGYGPHFADARRRYGEFDLSLIPIGAYRPRPFMAPVHLDPQHAVRAHQDLGSRKSVAIHHGTFQLTYEGIDEPYVELAQALEDASIGGDAFRVLGFGESMIVTSRIARHN